jgi:hypothetical protein
MIVMNLRMQATTATLDFLPCDSDKLGDLTSIETPKLRLLSKNRRDHYWTDTLNGFQNLDHTLRLQFFWKILGFFGGNFLTALLI